MENTRQFNGQNLLLGSLIIAFLLFLSTIGRVLLKTLLKNDEMENLFYLPIIVFISWGILKGLSYKDNGKLTQHVAIKKAFRLIFIGVAIFCLIFFTYVHIVDPPENIGLMTYISIVLIIFSYITLSVLALFFIGIIPALVVRFIKIRLFK